jgi:hypothetical protein
MEFESRQQLQSQQQPNDMVPESLGEEGRGLEEESPQENQEGDQEEE